MRNNLICLKKKKTAIEECVLCAMMSHHRDERVTPTQHRGGKHFLETPKYRSRSRKKELDAQQSCHGGGRFNNPGPGAKFRRCVFAARTRFCQAAKSGDQAGLL